MKEVTYKDWQKNPTPRMMWVWDYSVDYKHKRKVIHILDEAVDYPVMIAHNSSYETYMHCAEIEELKTRRMTNQEFAWWLRNNPTREYKYNFIENSSIYYEYTYTEEEANELIDEDIVIRENGGKWREPLIEVEE